MSLADMNDALEDHLLGDKPDISESTGFTIDDLTKADWAVRKVAQARRRLANALEAADANRARIADFVEAEKQRCESSTAFLLDQLERFHRAVLDDDAKAKTLRVPCGGELVARKAPDTVHVEADEVTEWARTHGHTELFRVKLEADKPNLKRFTRPDGDRVVHIETGEVVPGVEWREGQVTFSVKTEADR